MDMSREDVIEEILKKIPKLSSHELPSLYEELDKMTRRIGEIITTSTLFEKESKLVRFDKASKEDIVKLIIKGRDVMIPFFVMICGFSERELERYGLRDIYSLRRKQDIKKQNMVADIITKF